VGQGVVVGHGVVVIVAQGDAAEMAAGRGVVVGRGVFFVGRVAGLALAVAVAGGLRRDCGCGVVAGLVERWLLRLRRRLAPEPGVFVGRKQHFPLSAELQAAGLAHTVLAELGLRIMPPGQK